MLVQLERGSNAGIIALFRFGASLANEETMGDDVTIIVPEPTTEEETYEQLGEELLSRLDEIAQQLGEANARIIELTTRVIELESRQFAAPDHEHSGFAPTEHSHEHEHEGYARTDHEHEERKTEERKPDRAPEKQHPYFRKLGEF